MLNAKLIIVGGKAKTKEVRLQLPTTIGRGKEADLTIPHALVSRSHTLLFERDGQLCAKDLGSLNGTFVDNQRIKTEQIILPNQLLTLGDITFRAVYDNGQSAKETLPNNNDPSSFQTISIDPIKNKTSSNAEQTVDAPAAIDVAETTPPRSAISEIDSFDPDEIGSLDAPDNAEPKSPEPQSPTPEQPISSNLTLATPVNPTLRNPPEPSRTLAPKPPTPSANSTEQAHVVQLNSAYVNLDIPEDNSPAPVSFVGNIQTDDNPDSTSVINDFQIDLGSDIHSKASVNESQIGSFLKNLPK